MVIAWLSMEMVNGSIPEVLMMRSRWRLPGWTVVTNRGGGCAQSTRQLPRPLISAESGSGSWRLLFSGLRKARDSSAEGV